MDQHSPIDPFVSDLQEHKMLVTNYLQKVISDLVDRAIHHDDSKLSDEEYPEYSSAFGEFKRNSFGSPGYKNAFASISNAWEHHSQSNRHHPEYYQNGICGMTLTDIIEMICDWKGSSEREGSTTSFDDGLAIQVLKLGIDSQLLQIIKNSIAELEEK